MIATLARAFSRTARAEVDAENLKIVAIFCVAGLLLSLVAAMAFGVSSVPDLF
ncbi:hypothetical protein [Bradyrhizobium sp. 25ACV]